MAHPVDHHFVTREFMTRANTALLLTVVWGGLAACAFGAVIYDLGHLIDAW